ncbi:MAG: hypothetical protein JSS68_14085 [Actinobacteria bacterium]|nr:hypothetical protein [Actinomycetota bacterium]
MLVGLGFLVIAALGVALILSRSGSAPTIEEDAAQRAGVLAHSLTAGEGGRAAWMALAAERLHPGVLGQLGMLEVALEGSGVERVIETGADQVTSAIRLEHLVLTAGSNDVLRVWRPSNGALLGEVKMPRPLVTIGEAPGLPLAAGADASGLVSLIDVSDPHHPRLLPLANSAGHGSALAVAFSEAGKVVLVLSKSGRLERFLTVGGRPLGSDTVTREFRGQGSASPAQLVAAQFVPEPYDAPRHLLLDLADGAVFRESVGGRAAKLVLAPGKAPGPITSVAQIPYGEVAVGTRGGLVTIEKPGAFVDREPGPPLAGVAFNSEEELLVAESEGVGRRSEVLHLGGIYGRPAIGLTVGHGGVLALDEGGAVSLLGPLRSGLGLPQPPISSPAVSGPRRHRALLPSPPFSPMTDRREAPPLEEFAGHVASLAPRLGGAVHAASRLGPDLRLDSFDLVRLDALLFERYAGGLALSRRGIDWLALTVREAYELCLDHDLADCLPEGPRWTSG